jgi:hypothetical protein
VPLGLERREQVRVLGGGGDLVLGGVAQAGESRLAEGPPGLGGVTLRDAREDGGPGDRVALLEHLTYRDVEPDAGVPPPHDVEHGGQVLLGVAAVPAGQPQRVGETVPGLPHPQGRPTPAPDPTRAPQSAETIAVTAQDVVARG